ncbi:hypothetical protein ALMP_64780, partial [Streptomyces sp. A012304]
TTYATTSWNTSQTARPS